MDPLDLTVAPPRRALEMLCGVAMLARTIDKMRASLPGGKLGAYKIAGYSTRMLEALGLDQDEMQRRVAEATSDDEIVAWVQASTTPEAREAFNRFALERCIADRADDADFFERYPIARTLPPSTPLLVLLEHDDRASFDKLRMTQ